MNEDALERERRNSEALRRRLSDLEGQATQGTALEPALTDAKNRLQQAEAEVARLQNAVNKLKQQLQVRHIYCAKAAPIGYNPLNPDIKMHILLTVLHTFLMELVRRICQNIKTSYPWCSLLYSHHLNA